MGIEGVIAGRDRWCVAERDAIAVLDELPVGSVDAVITDPPYGIGFQSTFTRNREEWSGPRFGKIIGDEGPLVEFLPRAVSVLREGGALFVFCEWRHQEAFRLAIEKAGATVRSHCVWDREHHGMGDLRQSFAPCHDIGWFATKGRFEFSGPRPQTVLRFQRVQNGELVHPAQKPIALMRHLVSRLVPVGGVVLDPFAGSGTTGAAALLEGRRSICCEVDPQHAFTARRRLESVDGVADLKNPRQGGLFASKKPMPKEGLTT